MERSIFSYAKSNEYEKIKVLLDEDDVDVNERDDYGRTALHICATNDCLESLRVLLCHPQVKIDYQDYESGWTPLHRAVYFKHYRIALTLIKAGAKLGDEYCTDYKSSIIPRKDPYRSVRNWSKWTPNIDHEGNSPLDLLSCSLAYTLKNTMSYSIFKSRLLSSNNKTNSVSSTNNMGNHISSTYRKRQSTSVLTYGKSDFILGVVLPNNPYQEIHRPKRIETLESISFGLNGLESVMDICCSKYHSIALTNLGRVFSWGHGRSGRLGHGDESAATEPRRVTALDGWFITAVSSSENHTVS